MGIWLKKEQIGYLNTTREIIGWQCVSNKTIYFCKTEMKFNHAAKPMHREAVKHKASRKLVAVVCLPVINSDLLL